MELDELSYARCKACDTLFYPAWRPSRGSFEDLCHVCKPAAIRAAYHLEEDYDNFLDGYLADKRATEWTE